METNNYNQYTRKEFESFADGVKKLSTILKSNNPDYIFAPIIGSVPLIDLLAITDRHFPLDIVEYPPNSSRFSDREKTIEKWYTNFLKKNYFGKKMKIICVDELISGSSAVKGYTEFQRVLYDYGKKIGERLEKKLDYEILGIGEMPKSRTRNHGIRSMLGKKKAYVVEVDRIITCDNPVLNPVKLKVERQTSSGSFIYKPEIEKFEISQDYLRLLKEFAEYFGVDPDGVESKNLMKIKESLEKYLK